MSSSSFNKCMKTAVMNIIQDLSTEGFEDGESFDPWELEESLPFTYGSSPAERMGITLNGIALHGLSHTIIKSVRSNLNDNNRLRLELDVYNPGLYLLGNYSVELIGTEPVGMGGFFNVSFNDITGTLVLKGHTTFSEGIEYLKLDRASFRPQISDFHLDLDSPEDPYPEMTEMVLALVNSYWRLVYYEALPTFEEAYDSLFRTYLDEALAGVPFSEIVSL